MWVRGGEGGGGVGAEGKVRGGDPRKKSKIAAVVLVRIIQRQGESGWCMLVFGPQTKQEARPSQDFGTKKNL